MPVFSEEVREYFRKSTRFLRDEGGGGVSGSSPPAKYTFDYSYCLNLIFKNRNGTIGEKSWTYLFIQVLKSPKSNTEYKVRKRGGYFLWFCSIKTINHFKNRMKKWERKWGNEIVELHSKHLLNRNTRKCFRVIWKKQELYSLIGPVRNIWHEK